MLLYQRILKLNIAALDDYDMCRLKRINELKQAAGKANFLLEERGSRLFREMEYALVREKQPGIGEIMPGLSLHESLFPSVLEYQRQHDSHPNITNRSKSIVMIMLMVAGDVDKDGHLNYTESDAIIIFASGLHTKLLHYSCTRCKCTPPIRELPVKQESEITFSIQKHEEKPVVAKAEADARCTIKRVTVERVNAQARER
ncbi:hypothetical protein Tco_1001443 [Tanacetum coccineum]